MPALETRANSVQLRINKVILYYRQNLRVFLNGNIHFGNVALYGSVRSQTAVRPGHEGIICTFYGKTVGCIDIFKKTISLRESIENYIRINREK